MNCPLATTESKTMTYGSLEEFISDISTDDFDNHCVKHNLKKSWSGVSSFKEAVQIAREGLEVERINLDMSNFKHEQVVTETHYDVSGATVDVGTFLSGVPECMLNFTQASNPKMVTIYVDARENGGASDDIFTDKAKAISCLVDELESRGIRVCLNVFTASYIKTTDMVLVVNVKKHHETLSISQIAGCCSIPFMRVLNLTWKDKYFTRSLLGDEYGFLIPSSRYPKFDGVTIRASDFFPVKDAQKFVDHYIKGI
jgi:hypothetical protein